MLLLVVAVVSGAVWGAPPGEAVVGSEVLNNPGVVRIYEAGRLVGSGMLVDRNWVLTAGPLIVADPSQYTFRFGGTDDSQDGNSQANLRTFDRIVVHPTVPGLVMVHFADPTPNGTAILPIASTAPFTPSDRVGLLLGWGDPRLADRRNLKVALATVIDSNPATNVAALRAQDPEVWSLTGDARMLALSSHVSRPGDSGGPLLRGGSAAAAMHWGAGIYRRPNATGALTDPAFGVSYEIALWPYASWIQSVIDGEGSGSSPSSPHDELKRRKLEEGENAPGQAVMTGPTPCPGDGSCDPEPVTPLATLVGFSSHQGSVAAKCAGSDDGDSCSYENVSSSKGSTSTLQIAPAPTTGVDATTGRRDVVVWCKYTGSLTTGAPPGDLVRFSFTNTDVAGVTPAYGWWDVAPQQVEDSPDNPLSGVDLDQLSTCPN